MSRTCHASFNAAEHGPKSLQLISLLRTFLALQLRYCIIFVEFLWWRVRWHALVRVFARAGRISGRRAGLVWHRPCWSRGFLFCDLSLSRPNDGEHHESHYHNSQTDADSNTGLGAGGKSSVSTAVPIPDRGRDVGLSRIRQ